MIEGESDFIDEEDMMRAIEVGHAAVKDLCLGEISVVPPPPLNVLFVWPRDGLCTEEGPAGHNKMGGREEPLRQQQQQQE